MEFRILGATEVLDGNRRVALPAGRGRALLALLLLHAGEAVTAERLIDELWGERPPPTAGTVVQGLVSRLRKALEPERRKGDPSTLLHTVGAGYRLAISPDALDADRFKRLVDEARSGAPEFRSAKLTDALGLWHGPALADFRYEPFAQQAITALEEARLTAIEDRVETDLALGRSGDLVGEVSALIDVHPFRERLRELQMLALYRAGRQADALQAYRDARTVLNDELGIEPGPALRKLEAAILRQESALDLATPQRTEIPAEGSWLPRERRPVTVVAVDLALRDELEADPEALERLGTRATEAATEILGRHGARVERVFGDMLMAFFGLPVAHEDDAVRAVRAVMEVRETIDAWNADPPSPGTRYTMRAGVSSGDIVVGGPGASLRDLSSGSVVTAAGRLQQAASDGDVLVGEATQRLIRGAVMLKPAHAVAARAGTDRTWRALDLVGDAPAVPRSFDTAMVGRQSELTTLRGAFRRTLRSDRASVFTLLGEAGIGKSRLAKEFVASIGSEAHVVTGRCPAYGEGITFLPLREAVLEAVGPLEWNGLADRLREYEGGGDAAEQIAAAIGLAPEPGNVNAVFPAVRRLFSILASDRPLVVVLEDLHWAEPTFLDLVDDLAREGSGRVFVLGIARPDLIERRPDWSTTATLTLGPLSAREIEDLIVERASAVAPETLQRIVHTARGNPLFAEQSLAAIGEVPTSDIPGSLQSLLTMRLDRLGPGERDLLRCAAVVGIDPGRDAVTALLPEAALPFVDRHIDGLERKQLIFRDDSGAFRFGHVLVQLAAYQSMTREDRARLHERFADWLESDRSAPPELDEVVGYHLEQAVEHRRASGAGRASALAVRAGERLARAAERARARLDQTAAENLMARARALLPVDHPDRAMLTQRLAEVDLVLGRFPEAQEMLRDLAEAAVSAGDRSSEWTARLEHERIQFMIGPDPTPLATIRREAEEAAAYYGASGDDGGLERAKFLLGCVQQRAGEMIAGADTFRECITLADRSGDVRERLASRWMCAMLIVAGPVPVEDCIDECVEMTTSLGSEHPGLLTERGALCAMAGRFDEARALIERARHIFVSEIRAPRMLMFLAQSQTTIELLDGDLEAAEDALRTRLELARGSKEPENISQAAARLALVLRRLGLPGEAAELARESADVAPVDGVTEQALSRAARAGAASDEGDHASAERLARDAIALVPEEMLNLRADLFVELAGILRAADHRREADDATRDATRLYALKGNIAATSRLQTPR